MHNLSRLRKTWSRSNNVVSTSPPLSFELLLFSLATLAVDILLAGVFRSLTRRFEKWKMKLESPRIDEKEGVDQTVMMIWELELGVLNSEVQTTSWYLFYSVDVIYSLGLNCEMWIGWFSCPDQIAECKTKMEFLSCLISPFSSSDCLTDHSHKYK